MDSLEADNLEFLGLVLAKLERMKAPQCHRDPLVKPIAGKKYKEIRPGGSNTARLFYVVYERDIVLLLSGYTKKEMKLRPSELRLADSIYDDLKKGGGYYEEYEI